MISRDNNFDLIRLLAALEVSIGHIISHLECGGGGKFHLPFPGVFIFFVISGFLITSSYERNKDFRQYIKNRMLRIFPALWIAFGLVFIAIACFGYVNGEMLLLPQFWAWVVGQTTLFQFYTPDVLRSFGVGCPNGSLWTIPVEFGFYLVLPLIMWIFKKRRNIGLICLMVISVLINFLANRYGKDGVLFKLLGCSVFPWLYCFLIGSVIYLNWERIRSWFEGRFLIWLSVYLLYVFLVSGPSYEISSFAVLISNLLLACTAISAAYTYPKIGKMLHGYDISYGLYVYHMVVVNVFVQLGLIRQWYYAVIVLLISLMIAFLSWTFVEKKTLAWKKKRVWF